MLYSALLSVALVSFIYVEYKKQTWTAGLAFLTVLMTVACVVAYVLPPAFLLHALWAIPGSLVWKWRQWSAISLRRYMIVAALPGYSVAVYWAFDQVIEQKRLADETPFESMESRVPAPKKSEFAKLPVETKENLTRLETSLLNQQPDLWMRENTLRKLHQSSIETFINSPGFGVARGTTIPDWSLISLDHRESTPSQPDAPFSSTLSTNDFPIEPQDVDRDSLQEMHMDGLLDFVNPRGFGLVQSRQKVLGFQPHRFSKIPELNRMKIHAIELVGILMHEEPVVYVSAKLPSMTEARKAPKRILNAFESTGLHSLREGNDLFIRETREGVRMLGAVRSIERCVACHGGEPGDLLGAFSYHLQRLP